MSEILFANQVDSVDVSERHIAVGLSSLEGNIWDGSIQTLSYLTGEPEQTLRTNSGVTQIRFIGEDKSILVAGQDNGSITLHKTEDITDFQLIPSAHDDCVSVICPDVFAPGMFLTGGWDGSIKMWDVYSNDLLKPVLTLEDAHQKPINDISVCRTGAGSDNLFASVGQDGFLRLWDQRMGLKSGCAQIHGLMQAVSCVEWDGCEGTLLYVGTDAGDIACYDIRQDNQAWTALQRVHSGRVRRIRSSTTAQGVLFSASDDCTVAVSDVAVLQFNSPSFSCTSKHISSNAGMTSLSRYKILVFM